MNILIVGNGFDLSHYLPTKYDHFMDVMGVIENWGESKGDMNFDDLFGSLYEKEDYFFDNTKAMYKTDEIKISGDQIQGLQEQLKENVWYQYFSDHVKEVKTWIDFETKIHDALNIIAHFIQKIESKYSETGYLLDEICFYGEARENQIFIKREYCNVLGFLNIFNSGYYLDEDVEEENGKFFTKIHDVGDPEVGDFRFYINNDYLQYRTGFSNIKVDLIFQNLQSSLDDFISIFNQYLELIVSQLTPKNQLKISTDDRFSPDEIYSFNYTNTYKRLYRNRKTKFLHGSHGEDQNIVLGVSDLESESLKKIKVYGFTKYQQKLFKDTDYLFVDEYKKIIKFKTIEITELERKVMMPIGPIYTQTIVKDLDNKKKSQRLNLNFYIWGHSLDISDKDYIIDLFSLNDDIDRNVLVTVYYFDKNSKFSLLNNLLAILGKDKVEQWMKNKWLQFKENPEVKFLEAEEQEIA
jgi:hypothetical protein